MSLERRDALPVRADDRLEIKRKYLRNIRRTRSS